MDFNFPEDTEMLRDMLRRFLQKEARPLEMKYYNTGELSPEERARLRQAIQQLGLWGLTVPEQFGGGGLDAVTACMIEEELGATFIPVEMGAVPTLLYACAGEQLSRFLEPALEGSRRPILAVREPHPAGIKPENWTTSATPDDEGFILNGQKILAASPGEGDFFILLAKAPQGLTAFLLDADLTNVQTSANGKMVLTLSNWRVPGEALLGQPGGALELARSEATRAWIQMGARYVGMVERLIEMAAEHARSWVSLGEPLAVRPAVQRMLAEMRVDAESARWLVYHAAWLSDNRQDDSIHGPAAQVRLATGEMLKRAVDRVTMIFAGPGPAPQIEPHLLIKSLVPPEALEIGLEAARFAIAAEMLDLHPA